jgi:hypothetical protein
MLTASVLLPVIVGCDGWRQRYPLLRPRADQCPLQAACVAVSVPGWARLSGPEGSRQPQSTWIDHEKGGAMEGTELGAYVVRLDWFFAGRWFPLKTWTLAEEDTANITSAAELAAHLHHHQDYIEDASFRIQVWRTRGMTDGTEPVAEVVHRERLADLQTYVVLLRRRWRRNWGVLKRNWQEGQRRGAAARQGRDHHPTKAPEGEPEETQEHGEWDNPTTEGRT